MSFVTGEATPLLELSLSKKLPTLNIELSLTLRRGEVHFLVGPSGSGKTTTLKMIALLRKPDKGFIRFKGNYLFKDNWKADHKAILDYRRRCPLVSQVPALIDDTLEENLLLPFEKLSTKARAELLREGVKLIDRLNIREGEGILKKMANEISVGEAKRICIIRALLLRPEVMLLDEPSANLDSKSIGSLTEVLREFLQRGGGLIIASHDEEFMRAFEGSAEVHELS